MELTDKQKDMVADFLRKQDESMGKLPSDKRVQILTQIKQLVREELLKVGKDVLSDGRVKSVLERIHITIPSDTTTPAEKEVTLAKSPTSEPKDKPDSDTSVAKKTEDPKPAEIKKETPSPVITETFEDDDRHWMGVCEVVSDQAGQSVTVIRGGFIVLGLLTGPIALLLYLGLYFITQKKSPARYPEIDLIATLSKVIRVVALTVGLHIIACAILFSAASAYTYLLNQPAELGGWSNVSAKNSSLLTFLILTLGPTAALSAMPLAHQWNKTLATITNLGLAIYAVILCLGISLSITGYILSGLNIQLGP